MLHIVSNFEVYTSNSHVDGINLELTALGNYNRLGGFAGLRANGLNLLHDIHTVNNGAKDAVLAVQPGGLNSAQEELGSVGVRSGVGHGQDTGSSVLQSEVLVGELGSIDGFTAGSVSRGEVATLAHKIGDNSVEGGSLEVEGLSRSTGSLLASAQGTEVLGGLRDDVSSQLHSDTPSRSATNGDIEEDLGVGHLGCFFVET